MLKAFFSSYRRHCFAWLFVTLLLTLVANPGLKGLAPGVDVLDLLMVVNLVTAIATVAHERVLRILLLLAIAFVGLRAVQTILGGSFVLSVTQLIWMMVALLAASSAAYSAFHARIIEREHIFAALDAYLLAGMAFGVCYWMMEQVWPESFGSPAPGDLDLPRAIYFSFVTLATLGYGDIVPGSDATRGLAITEGVAGQMYLAVLVARLVSLYSRQSDGKQGHD